MPLTQVGILDEHGPSLVLPSYSQECIADWIKSDADLLRNALKIFHSHKASSESLQALQDATETLHQAGNLGRLDATQFLPFAHGGKDMTISFNFFLPPPYRVLMLIALGLVCFASNLHILHRIGLDPAQLPNFSAKKASQALPHHQAQQQQQEDASPEGSSSGTTASQPVSVTPSRYHAVYAIGLIYGALSCFGWLLFRYWVDGPAQGDPFGNHAQAYQAIVFFGAIILAFWPGSLFFRSTRFTFSRMLLRISIPSFRQHISFGDVILADILTSFAKIFGDVWLSICFLWPRREHHTWWNGKGSIIVPIMTSIPYLIRLRQCLSEYATSEPSISLSAGKGRRSRKPLANALKYASALPVIWLSTLHELARDVQDVGLDARMKTPEELATGLRAYKGWFWQLWLLSVFVNSIFSFWWDVTNDWGLDILRFSTWSSAAPSLANGVRESLHKRGISTITFAPPTPQAAVNFLASSYRRLSWQAVRDKDDDGAAAVTSSKKEEDGIRMREKRSIERNREDEDEVAEGRTSLHVPMDHSEDVHEKPESSKVAHQRATSLLTPHVASGSTQLQRSGSGSSGRGGGHHRRNTSLFLRDPERVGMLLFHPFAYQVVVVLDLVLRFLWSLKLSSHLQHVVTLEGSVFFIEALEIIRRWAWTFLRVEWEFVRQRRVVQSVAGMGLHRTPDG